MMAQTNFEHRRSDHDAEKQSPNYRAKSSPRADQSEQPSNCHPVNPPAAPSSAAENHEDANQKCNTKPPLVASKDEREKSTG